MLYKYWKIKYANMIYPFKASTLVFIKFQFNPFKCFTYILSITIKTPGKEKEIHQVLPNNQSISCKVKMKQHHSYNIAASHLIKLYFSQKSCHVSYHNLPQFKCGLSPRNSLKHEKWLDNKGMNTAFLLGQYVSIIRIQEAT